MTSGLSRPVLFVRHMWFALAISSIGIAILAANKSPALIPALPLLLAWFASPLFAYWMSRNVQKEVKDREEDVEMSLRLNARSTWKFLETSFPLTNEQQLTQDWFSSLDVTPENIGRFLVWSRAAYELGAISKLKSLECLEAMISAMEPYLLNGTAQRTTAAIPRHILIGERGHLAGFLRGLIQHSRELSGRPLFDERVVDGLTDTLLLMKNEFLTIRAITPRGQADAILYDLSEEIENCLDFLRAEARSWTTAEWNRVLNTMKQRAAVIEVTLSSFSAQCHAINVEGLQYWTNDFLRQTQELNRELYLFAPWVSVRLAHVEPIIRKHCPSLLDSWNHIIDSLNCLPPASRIAKHFEKLSIELARLFHELEPSLPANTADRETALKRYEELGKAMENSSQAAEDATLRCANLANRCEAIPNFRPLYDTEYKVLRSQFQLSMLG